MTLAPETENFEELLAIMRHRNIVPSFGHTDATRQRRRRASMLRCTGIGPDRSARPTSSTGCRPCTIDLRVPSRRAWRLPREARWWWN